MELPAIMQWLKQTFAQRHNALTGHILGDRYWSEILAGDPPEAVRSEAAPGAGAEHRDRPRRQKRRRSPQFSAMAPAPKPPHGPPDFLITAQAVSGDAHTPGNGSW
jgi:hypothetical protein